MTKTVAGAGPMEALLGETASGFLRGFKGGREQCWIAEVDGVVAGSIFVTGSGDAIPLCRALRAGFGITGNLVARVIVFAREGGYDKLQLSTHSIPTSARRLYAAVGMEIVSREVHHAFGKPEQGETWVMISRWRT